MPRAGRGGYLGRMTVGVPAEHQDERIDEQVAESFPGSDAPASTMGHGEPSAASAATLLAAAISERDAAGVAGYCDEACVLTIGEREFTGREAIAAALTSVFTEHSTARLEGTIVGADGSALELVLETPRGPRPVCWIVRPALPSFSALRIYR